MEKKRMTTELGSICLHCGKEYGEHQGFRVRCPEKETFFSNRQIQKIAFNIQNIEKNLLSLCINAATYNSSPSQRMEQLKSLCEMMGIDPVEALLDKDTDEEFIKSLRFRI